LPKSVFDSSAKFPKLTFNFNLQSTTIGPEQPVATKDMKVYSRLKAADLARTKFSTSVCLVACC